MLTRKLKLSMKSVVTNISLVETRYWQKNFNAFCLLATVQWWDSGKRTESTFQKYIKILYKFDEPPNKTHKH